MASDAEKTNPMAKMAIVLVAAILIIYDEFTFVVWNRTTFGGAGREISSNIANNSPEQNFPMPIFI